MAGGLAVSRASRNSRIVVAFLSPLTILIALVAAVPGALVAQQQQVQVLTQAGQTRRSVSMVSADFDEDGVTDLAIGYATGTGGAISLMRGNHDAIAPRTEASWLAAGRHELTVPFLQPSQLIRITVEPDFLIAADVNGDGHRDLVFAGQGGSRLQVLAGTGKGKFAAQPVSIEIPGSITALAAYRPGAPTMGDALLVGYQTAQGARLAIVSNGAAGLGIRATYKLPGAATAISVANLDGDSIPDAAIVAGGQLVILHGANAISGGGQLETLPVENVEAVTAGEFLMDRHGLLQLAALNANGDVLILAHQGFDARPFTAQEIQATLSHGRGSKRVTPLAGDTSGEPWTVVETDSMAGVHGAGSALPILVRSRIGGSGGEDLVVLNAAQQQRVTISHPMSAAQANAPMRSRMAAAGLGSEKVIAAASVRVNADGRPGLAVLREGKATPEFTVPSTGNTFYPNTLADNTGTTTDSDDGTRCTQGAAEVCTLRDAVVFANADAAVNMTGGTSDTIMLSPGTYNLTWQAGTLDSQSNAVTHLEVLGPVTFVGTTAGGGTIINANSNDVALTINPGPYGYYNPGTGASYAFDTTLENITIENGANPDNLNNNGNANDVGGGINWDADGTGNLNLDSVTITNSTVQYGAGGGLWIENSAGSGSGTATLTGGTISNNGSAEQGGGVYVANPYATLSATNTEISGNTAAPSVNASDPGGYGAGGGLFIDGQSSSTNSPQSTLTGVTISGNSATVEGGGIYTNSGVSISGSTLSGNSTSGTGGGIYAEEGPGEVSTTITGSNITTNSADAGGGVYVGNDNPSTSVPSLVMSLSRIIGNTSTSGSTGLVLEGSGAATATENWWGCNAGPASSPCDTADGTVAVWTPWAELALSGSASTVTLGNSIDLTVSLNTDSNGGAIAGAFPAVNGESVSFNVTGVTANPTLTAGTFGSAGTVTPTLTPDSVGSGQVTATFDNQTTAAFDFQVGTAPAITSGNSATFTVGAFGSFTVTTTGTPTPALSEIDALPGGMTFIDNGNGTGILSGTPAVGSGGTYIVAFEAANGISPLANQTFTLTVNQAPAITSAAGTTFVVGTPGAFIITTIGSPTPALSTASTLPSGVAFIDNGNGRATLAGIPAAGSGGIYPLNITASNGVGANAAQSFTLIVDQTPVITSANNTTFTAGAYGTFTVTSSAYPVPSISLGGPPLPNGVTLTDNGDGTATLAGIAPVSTTSSTFQFAINANNGVGLAAQQNFTLTVNPPPTFVVSNTDDSGAGSLRAALANSANVGGMITFDPTVFKPGNSAAANTITLSSATLTMPSNTTINGATSGSGATLANLVTVNGGTINAPIFTVTSSAINDVITNLTITGGSSTGGTAAGVYNGYQASLAINNSTISNNKDSAGTGGIFNDYGATLTIFDSTISGNDGGTGGILNETGGTIFVVNSTITGNAGTNEGGGILNAGTTLYVTGSTITGNDSPSGAGIYTIGGSQVTLSNTIVSGNTPSGQDISGTVTDNGGNVLNQTASSLELAPLGPYGGPTQTMPALPGSPAFCAGTQDNAMAQSSDQRGFARTTTYPNGGTPITCVDAGAVETDYTLSFTTNPPALPATGYVGTAISPAPVVSLTENNQTVTYSGGSVSMADVQSQLTSPSSTLAAAFSSGAASFSNLVFPSTATNDALAAAFTLTAAGAAVPVSVSASSTLFSVANGATTTTAANAQATFSASAQNVTLTATVTSGGNNVNVGTVSFTLLNGATPVGTTTTGAVSGGAASVSYVLPAGTAVSVYTIQAAYNPISPYLASADSTHTLNVEQAAQSINFTAPASPVAFGVGPVTLSATATSGLSVAFTIDASSTGTGSITGNTLTITGAGNLVIDANQVGSANYLTATQVQRTIVVNKAAQTINFTAPASPVTFGVGPVTLSATSTSGLSVTFTIDGGSTGAGTIIGNTLTITGAGNLVIDANQTGNGNYSGATQVQRTIIVNKATQTINFTAPASPVTFGVAPVTLSASSTSGLSVTFTIDASSSGTGSIAGNTLTITGAGNLIIDANQVGSANYLTATEVQRTIVVNKAAQTINFTAPISPVTFGVAPVTLSATSTSGLSVTFTIDASSTGTGSIAGNTLTITGAGNLIIDANQVGSATYLTATQVQRTIVVNKAAQTINFTAPTSPVTFGVAPVTLSATSTSGLTVAFTIDGSSTGTGSIAGNALTITGAGTIVIDANQAGNGNYTAATQLQRTIIVNKAAQTINFTAPISPVTFGVAPVTLSATSTSGLTVTFTIDGSSTGTGTIVGNTLTITGAGNLVIDANQVGSANYLTATQVQQGIVVNKANATVTLGSLAQTYSGSPEAATATTTPAGLTVNLTYTGTNGTTYATSATAPTGAGSYTVAATVNNANYSGTASGTLVIGKAAATVALGSLAQTYSGSAEAATATTTPAGLTVNLTYTGTNGTTYATSATAPTGAGSYTVAATVNNANYSGAATGTLVISKAAATVKLGNLAQTYSGSPESATASTTPSGLAVSFTYNGSSTAPTAASSYAVVATVNDPNYAGTATGTLVIAKASSSTSLTSNANPVLLDNAITFTATVTSTAGTPSGTVSFYDGTTLLGQGALSGGVASYTTSSLAVGAHTITADYGGDSNFLVSTSSALGEVVQDFSFNFSLPSATILPGGTASFTFTVKPTNGATFPSDITFTSSGLPSGYTGTFSPNPIPAGTGATTVTFTLSPSTTAHNAVPGMSGSGTGLAARRNADGQAAKVAGSLAPFALALMLLPFAGRMRRAGKRLGRMLSVLLLLGAGLAAVTGLSGCGSSNGFFGQAPHTYTITITGTSGGLSHSGTVTVTIE